MGPGRGRWSPIATPPAGRPAPDRHPLDVDLPSSGEFLLGPDLLIAAAPFPDKLDDYDATLPGTGWYDYWTGLAVTAPQVGVVGGGLQPEAGHGISLPAVHIHPLLEALPVFVRPGSILPVAPVVQSTAEMPQGPLTLRVFPGPDCHGQLYLDDGISFRYLQGNFLRIAFTCTVSNGATTVHVGSREGRFPAWWKQLRVEVNGISNGTHTATVDGRPVPVDTTQHRASVLVTDTGKAMEIVLR